jgi:type I restriction enzyme S subunit
MSELPTGWVETTLTQIAAKITDGSHNPPREQPTGLPMLSAKNIRGGVIWFDEYRRVSLEDFEVEHRRTRISKGDVLLTIVGAIGRSAVVERNEPFTLQRSVAVLGELAGMCPHYLQQYTSGPEYQNWLLGNAKGTAQKGIYLKKLSESVVKVPPLAEQKRIVTKLNALSGKSARVRTELARIETLVSRYKQAVLSKAFSGELTREWRESADVNIPWQKKTIADVATIASGQTPKGIESALTENGEVSWFKVSSMNEPDNLEGLHRSQFRVSSIDARKLGLKIYPVGSVAFPKRGGAIATNKKRKLRVAAALDLNLMVLTATEVDPGFLWWWMQKLDLATISNGSNVPQINNGDIAPLEIEVPPLEEQHEIVCRIETAFAKIDRLAKEAKRALELVGKLDEAILAKAFRGELVSQDENDEPASVLLERIRAEREAAPKAKRGRSKS